jgi:hypothetical protein
LLDSLWNDTISRAAQLDISEAAIPVVYFISAAAKPRHPIKIGFSSTRSVRNRLAQIQTGYPYPLEILLVIEGTRDLEQEMHRALRAYRLRGEWFKRGKPLLDFIRTMEAADPNWGRLTDPIQVRRRSPA